MIGMSCMFNLSEPLVIPRKKISTFEDKSSVEYSKKRSA